MGPAGSAGPAVSCSGADEFSGSWEAAWPRCRLLCRLVLVLGGSAGPSIIGADCRPDLCAAKTLAAVS